VIVKLDDLGVIFGILASAVAVFGGLFAALRYVIKAETSELRPNGGSTLKDAVRRIETAQAHTKAALDEHITDSRKLITRGAEDKAAIEARQDKTDRTIATLAEAVKIAAQSTPPEEHE
jgi:hypothetical protein